MIQTWKTGSTISCLWPPRADHAGVPVMLPRKSDSDMCRDGANTANVRFQHPVDEPGRVHGVSDPRHIADLASLSSNRGQLLAMKERWRWRKLRKSGSQIRGQDKSRASFGHAMACFLRLDTYGSFETSHTCGFYSSLFNAILAGIECFAGLAPAPNAPPHHCA